VTLSQLGQKEDSERYLLLALYINPLLRDAYGALGNLYVGWKELDKAAHTFESATLTYPKDKELWLNLGFIYTELNEKEKTTAYNEKAYRAFKQAYQLDPQFQQAWNNLRILVTQMGRTEPLLDVPVKIQTFNKLLNAKNYLAANKEITELIALMPDYLPFQLSQAQINVALGNREAAMAQVQAVLEKDPKNKEAKKILEKITQ